MNLGAVKEPLVGVTSGSSSGSNRGSRSNVSTSGSDSNSGSDNSNGESVSTGEKLSGSDKRAYVSRPVWRKALFGASGSPTFGTAPAAEEK